MRSGQRLQNGSDSECDDARALPDFAGDSSVTFNHELNATGETETRVDTKPAEANAHIRRAVRRLRREPRQEDPVCSVSSAERMRNAVTPDLRLVSTTGVSIVTGTDST